MEARAAKILADPSTSYWLKNALSTALQCDPLDVLHDSCALSMALRAEWRAIPKPLALRPENRRPDYGTPGWKQPQH